jgi:putative ABC transport system substrate-binding protein
MDRRAFLGTLTGGFLAAPLDVEGQQAGKVYRLGVLNSVPGRSHITKALEEGLRERGYVEGQNLAIEWSLGEHLPDGAAKLVRFRPDIIVAISLSAAVAAKQATTTIPIVVLIVGDAVAAGLVASLARPGGNITGVSTEVTPELSTKQLQLLKEVVPKVRRVAVLLNPEWGPNVARWNETRQAAQSLKLTLMRVEVRRPGDVEAAFAATSRERADALFAFGDPLLYILRQQIGDLAVKNHLPSVSQYREAAEAGGLISYGPNFAAGARQIATYVDKILKGAKPADLPVEQPTKFELVINLKTAKALGLTTPPSLLGRADEVIE